MVCVSMRLLCVGKVCGDVKDCISVRRVEEWNRLYKCEEGTRMENCMGVSGCG